MKIVIFDTNALLDLHKYTYGTLDKILKELEDKAKYKIIMLDRVYFEYMKNVKSVVCTPSDRHPIKLFENNMNTKLEDIKKNIKALHYNDLSNKYNTSLDTIIDDFINSKIVNFEKDLKNEISNLSSSVNIDKTKNNNRIQQFIKSFYPSQTYSVTKWLEMYKDIKLRVELKIPPYDPVDMKKEEYDPNDYFAKYGDFIVWLEMLSKLEHEKDDVVFIENERKVAFWKNNNYKEFFPFLIREIKEKCDINSFSPLSLENFVLSLQPNIDASVIQEVNSIKDEFDKINSDNEYIQNYVDTFYLPEFEENTEDLMLKSIHGGLVDFVSDIDYINEQIDFKNKKVEIDKPYNGIITVNVPIKYQCNCMVSTYFSTGEDYYPIYYKGDILYVYDATLVFDYYVNDNAKIIISPKSYNLTYKMVYYDEDSFKSNEFDEDDDLENRCLYCGTVLDDDNRSWDDPKICCDCQTGIEKIMKD